MRQSLQTVRLFALLAVFLATPLAALTGCGQMGGLYHPTAEEDVAAQDDAQESEEATVEAETP